MKVREWTGELRLQIENRLGKSVAKNVYFQGALKVMRPVYHDDSGQVCYYILNPGGGYLNGDHYRLNITVENNAQLILTTQSATKVYKTPDTPAYQETEIILNEGSYLEYIPDPLIAYRHAKYRQVNKIYMKKGATFLYSDIITPGWSPNGDRFSYDRIQLINEIYMDDVLVAYDHIKLTPDVQKMDELGFMEGYTHLGSMIVIGERTNNHLLEQLYDVVKFDTDTYKVGLSMLPIKGFTVRVLGNTTQKVEEVFSKIHRVLRQEWFGRNPTLLRKY